MDAGDVDVKNAIDGMIRNTKCGTSLWTTFRWLANIVYGLCWIVALPVELVMNRRVGRRYSGMLPLLFALPVFGFLMGASQYVLSTAARGLSSGDRQRLGIHEAQAYGMWVSLAMVLLVLFALVGHRIANWYRFRSDEQVHSHSEGIPFWVLPPRWLVPDASKNASAATPAEPSKVATVAASNAIIEAKPLGVPKNPSTVALVQHAARALAAYLRDEWRGFVAEWRSGDVPTGAIAWYAATIVHPILLLVLGFVVGFWHGGTAVVLQLAAVAIFLKARIQKAITVEMIYDIFDARIEQDFKSSLKDPIRLRGIERRGFAVPGIARVAAQSASKNSHQPADLDSRYASLLQPTGQTSETGAS